MRGVFVGVDVAKDRLDVAFRPSGEKLTVPNDRRGITRLVRTISRLTPECVVLEASGGYERRLLERLAEEELPVALVILATFVSSLALAVGSPKQMRSMRRCSRTSRR